MRLLAALLVLLSGACAGPRYELVKPIQAVFPAVATTEDADRQGECRLKYKVLKDASVVNDGTSCTDVYFCTAALATLENVELRLAAKGKIKRAGQSVKISYSKQLYDGETYEDVPPESPFPDLQPCPVAALN